MCSLSSGKVFRLCFQKPGGIKEDLLNLGRNIPSLKLKFLWLGEESKSRVPCDLPYFLPVQGPRRTSVRLAFGAPRGGTLAQASPTTAAAPMLDKGSSKVAEGRPLNDHNRRHSGISAVTSGTDDEYLPGPLKCLSYAWEPGILTQPQMGSPKNDKLNFSLAPWNGGRESKLTIELEVENCKYYLMIKRNEVLIRATTWMNLKSVVLNERSQSQKAICCHRIWFQLKRMFRIDKSTDRK